MSKQVLDTSDTPKTLLKCDAEKYGSNYQAHILEQYKIFLEMTDRVSQRRNLTNTYFLSINTLLISMGGFIAATASPGFNLVWVWRFALAGAGIVLCIYWYYLLRSYRQLNSGKFKVIHQIEQLLPIAPYDLEWFELKSGKDPNVYWSFSHVEQKIPFVFAFIYGILMIVAIASIFIADVAKPI